MDLLANDELWSALVSELREMCLLRSGTISVSVKVKMVKESRAY